MNRHLIKRIGIAALFMALAVAWFFPPLPYRHLNEAGIQLAIRQGVKQSAMLRRFGESPEHYKVAPLRWISPVLVEARVTYEPGMKGGWGMTLVLRRTVNGWRVVEEKDGYVV